MWPPHLHLVTCVTHVWKVAIFATMTRKQLETLRDSMSEHPVEKGHFLFEQVT